MLGNAKVECLILPQTVNVRSLGRLVDEDGLSYTWDPGTLPQLQKKSGYDSCHGGPIVHCHPVNFVPVITPVLEEPSSSTQSPEKPHISGENLDAADQSPPGDIHCPGSPESPSQVNLFAPPLPIRDSEFGFFPKRQ